MLYSGISALLRKVFILKVQTACNDYGESTLMYHHQRYSSKTQLMHRIPSIMVVATTSYRTVGLSHRTH